VHHRVERPCQAGESFAKFCVRTPDDALIALGNGAGAKAA